MSFTLAQSQRSAIEAACDQHHVAQLHLFGSALRSDFLPGRSDIDLLVEFQPMEPADLVEAYFGLEQKLCQSMGAAVDLVMASAIHNPIVRADIETSKRLIYAA